MVCYYNKLKELFESKECQLLTTEEELKQQVKKFYHKKVSFVAKCGHKNSVTITNFQSKSSGVLCKNCIKDKVSKDLVEQNKGKKEASKSTIQECEIVEKLQLLLQNNLQFVKTNEGCKSDVVVKPLHVEEDKWLRIQVKTTIDVCHGLYTFGLHGIDYTDHIILCHCINHNKFWLFPYDVVSKLKGSLNIGLTSKSIYHKYEVEEDVMIIKLIDYYQHTVLYSFDECMLPQSLQQQKEIEYKQKRIEAFPFIVFETPRYNQSYYDFKINNIPVQEKTAVRRKDKQNSYVVCLYRRFGKSYKAYKLGMNKFYWINIPETTIFFIFPEAILYQHGYIEDHHTDSQNKPMLFISFNFQDGWYHKYRYSYDKINETIFKEMFEIQ